MGEAKNDQSVNEKRYCAYVGYYAVGDRAGNGRDTVNGTVENPSAMEIDTIREGLRTGKYENLVETLSRLADNYTPQILNEPKKGINLQEVYSTPVAKPYREVFLGETDTHSVGYDIDKFDDRYNKLVVYERHTAADILNEVERHGGLKGNESDAVKRLVNDTDRRTAAFIKDFGKEDTYEIRDAIPFPVLGRPLFNIGRLSVKDGKLDIETREYYSEEGESYRNGMYLPDMSGKDWDKLEKITKSIGEGRFDDIAAGMSDEDLRKSVLPARDQKLINRMDTWDLKALFICDNNLYSSDNIPDTFNRVYAKAYQDIERGGKYSNDEMLSRLYSNVETGKMYKVASIITSSNGKESLLLTPFFNDNHNISRETMENVNQDIDKSHSIKGLIQAEMLEVPIDTLNRSDEYALVSPEDANRLRKFVNSISDDAALDMDSRQSPELKAVLTAFKEIQDEGRDAYIDENVIDEDKMADGKGTKYHFFITDVADGRATEERECAFYNTDGEKHNTLRIYDGRNDKDFDVDLDASYTDYKVSDRTADRIMEGIFDAQETNRKEEVYDFLVNTLDDSEKLDVKVKEDNGLETHHELIVDNDPDKGLSIKRDSKPIEFGELKTDELGELLNLGEKRQKEKLENNDKEAIYIPETELGRWHGNKHGVSVGQTGHTGAPTPLVEENSLKEAEAAEESVSLSDHDVSKEDRRDESQERERPRGLHF